MRKLIFIAIFLLPLLAMAQEVSYAQFVQDGSKVKIYYNLSAPADVSIYLSTDGGRNFESKPLRNVTGAVGMNVPAGASLCAIWDVLKDREKLQGDAMVFKVVAFTSQTITVGNVSFTMVYVGGGSFTMGCTEVSDSLGTLYETRDKRIILVSPIDCSDDEDPAHRVTVSSYLIGETEVTQALWKAVMGSEPIYNGGWTSEYGRGDAYPAYSVSYDNVKEFIKRLNQRTGKHFRLPTEAEWEYAARGGSKSQGYKYSGSDNVDEVPWYAARGGSKSQGYKYSGSDNVDEVAWYNGNSGNQTHPVKQKRPNELGLYDMSGNVDEWCSDWYGDYSDNAQTNPQGPANGDMRVIRGGFWGYLAERCRVSDRGYSSPSSSGGDIGFRLVMEP